MNTVLRVTTVCIALAVVLTGVSAFTQQTERPEGNRDFAKLEKRLAELERQIRLLLKEVQELRREIHPQVGSPKVTVFRFRELDAASATRVLKDIFGTSQAVHGAFIIEADSASNSVVVVGPAEKAQMVKEILDKLDTKPK
jgi:type II secretory pathway component GspD/PulD (secretin)